MSNLLTELSNATSITVGTSITGEISTAFEKDFYCLNLTQGEQVSISLVGSGISPLFDPSLELLDPSGKLIEFSSDIDYPDNRNAKIEFIAQETGTYFVDAYASGPMTGAYDITTAASVYSPTDGIDWGTKIYDTTIEVYFGQAGDWVDYDVSSAEAMTTYELNRFWAAFGLIEAVTNLTFVEAANWYSADMEIYVDTNELSNSGDGTLLGYFGPPGELDAGTGVFNGAAWDRTGFSSTMEFGGFDFTTITHELLHGLGLAHPHDDGGTSDIFPGVQVDSGNVYTPGDYNLNQGIFTTMSYSGGFYTLFDDFTEESWGDYYGAWGYEIGPMALDIAVLQEKYGANMTTATGNDVYVIPDENEVGTGWRAIWDAGGRDEVRYNGARDIQIDLRAATLLQQEGGGGYLSAAYDVAGGFTIANGVVIEIARAGSGDDLIVGNHAANTLFGGSGHDTIKGGSGNDIVYGGTGRDTVALGVGNDTFIDVKRFGRSEDDTVYGGDGDDTITAYGGRDTLYGGDGEDNISGGAGADFISGGAANDQIYGSWGDDRVYGDSGNDTIYGGIGHDYIVAGAGDDWVRGGSGRDEVYLSGGNDTYIDDKQFGLRAADIVDGGAGDDVIIGYGGRDTFSGGTGEDEISGGAGADVIKGGDGNDVLRGSWGSDKIVGEAGDDVLTGGYDADTFYYDFEGGHDTITDLLFRDNDKLLISDSVVFDLDQFLTSGDATVTGAGVYLDFGVVGSLTITNLHSLDGLGDIIDTFEFDL